MVKEKVNYTNETTPEFEVYKLSYRKVEQLINKYLPLDKLKLKNGEIVMPDDFDNRQIFKLMEECVSTIKGLDLEQLEAEEIGRLYKKYFEKSLLLGLGGKGDPNLKES